MSTEQFEAEANRMTMKVTEQGVRITGTLTQSTWDQLRHLVAAQAQHLRETFVAHTRSNGIGGHVTGRRLEELSRGQRASVDLTDPAVARVVKKELARQGVTYALTTHEGQRRVHVSAGNVEQLTKALEHAENVVAERLTRDTPSDDPREVAQDVTERRTRTQETARTARSALKERAAELRSTRPDPRIAPPARTRQPLPTELPEPKMIRR